MNRAVYRMSSHYSMWTTTLVIVMIISPLLLLSLVNAQPALLSSIRPVPLPDPGIPGFRFPEPPATVLNWIKNDDQTSIQRHAWGIWTAFTAVSGEKFEGQDLRVFETWLTPGEMCTLTLAAEGRSATMLERNPRPLTQLHQLIHTEKKAGEAQVTGFVKYDPTAAHHALYEQLFLTRSLSAMLGAGDTEIPDFPPTAIAIKPVFQTLNQLEEGRYYRLRAWPGSPYDDPNYKPLSDSCWPNEKGGVTQGFGPGCWPECVWIDIKGSGDGPNTHATARCDGPRQLEAIYPVDNFIHFQNQSNGEYSVLVGMHVTSREINRWGWQTFWWSHRPDNPKAPSSKAIATKRPAQLEGAARNYAHCAAYSMVNPAQPYTRGSNQGESVYCYNPWLEAGFDSSVVPDSEPGIYKGRHVANNVGIQTNCMSCHAQATYSSNVALNNPNNPDGLQGKLYTGDRYIDLEGAQFRGLLKTDFLWSVPQHAFHCNQSKN